MALPRKEDYILREGKVIYILQGPIETNKKGQPVEYYKHGVGFNTEGRGSTSSFRDRTALLKMGFRDISKKHWEAKAKEYERLIKAEEKPKSKAKPKPEPEHKDEPEDEVEEEKG